MKHADIAKKLRDMFLREGATDVVVTLEEQDATQLKFSNSMISATQMWNSISMDIFIAVGKKLVTTSVHELSESAVHDVVSRLMKFAESAQPNPEYTGIAKGPFTYASIPDTYDAAIAENAVDMPALVEKGIAAAKNNGAKRTAGVLETGRVGTYVLTSNDVETEEMATRAYFSLRAFVEKNESGHCVANSRMLADCDIEGAASRAAQIARQAQNPKPGRQGAYDVLFEPLAASNLLEQVGKAASAFAVESGLSCFVDKLNMPVGGKSVTLVDDPLQKGAVGSSMFDAEGVPTQRNTIIENGVLKTYLHNTSTAARHKTRTTANAGLISPEPFNLVMQKGNVNKAGLFEQIQMGLWVTNVWYTRFRNYESGDFSTIPRDGIFLIEDGKITGSVRDVRISENLLSILANIKAVGDDSQQVRGWEVDIPVTTPSLLVGDVHITRSVE